MDERIVREIEIRLFSQPLCNMISKLSYVRRLERAWQLIESEFTDSALTLKKAAIMSGASKNHLNVLLHRATGLTFHQLLVRYRLLRAMAMMEAKNFSFLEIALETGFGSLNTFERNFRSRMGTTPRDFKISLGFWYLGRDFSCAGRDFGLTGRDFQ